MVLGMSSVLEIERAIEGLPTAEMLEVAEWLDVRRGMIAASESVFQMLDEEEGETCGGVAVASARRPYRGREFRKCRGAVPGAGCF
jgi:hypothetical protein